MATTDPTNRSGDALVTGQSISISGDSPLVRDLVISLNPGGSAFGWAPGSSSSWGASSGELPDEAELELPLRASCSFIRWCQAFLQLELWLWWCHLRSPRVEGRLPTEAPGQDRWTLTHFGYSSAVRPLTSLVASVRVGISWPIC